MQKVSYIYSGETRTFYFNFPYFEKSNIVVTVDNKPAPAYNVIGNKGGLNPDFPFTSGRIVFEKPLKKFETITIERHLPYVRQVDFQPAASITPSALNLDMNYTMELLKDIKDEFDSFSEKYADIVDKESTNLLLEKINLVNQNIANMSEHVEIFDSIPGMQNTIESLQNTIAQLNTTLSGYGDSIGQINTKLEGLSDFIIDYQEPTSDNGYTWYKKYKSRKVEMGGQVKGGFAQSTNWNSRTVQLPVVMANTDYMGSVSLSWNWSSGVNGGQDEIFCYSATENSMTWRYINLSNSDGMFCNWSARGIYAE